MAMTTVRQLSNGTKTFQQKPSLLCIVLICLFLLSPFNPTHDPQNNGLVNAIKCYVCQSNVDPKCADPFDNITLPITDCDAYPRADLVPRNEMDVIEEKGFFSSFSQPPPVKPLRATMCRKIRQKVNGEWRTIRGCGYIDPPQDENDRSSNGHNCKIRYGSNDVFMESCACNNKDGCNSAMSRVSFSPHLTLIFMTIPSFLLLASFFPFRSKSDQS